MKILTASIQLFQTIGTLYYLNKIDKELNQVKQMVHILSNKLVKFEQMLLKISESQQKILEKSSYISGSTDDIIFASTIFYFAIGITILVGGAYLFNSGVLNTASKDTFLEAVKAVSEQQAKDTALVIKTVELSKISEATLNTAINSQISYTNLGLNSGFRKFLYQIWEFPSQFFP